MSLAEPPTADLSRRIVLASSQQDWGGGEAYLTSLAQELRRRGLEVEFLVRAGSTLQEYVCNEKFSCQTIHGRGRNPWEIFRLRRWLHNQQPLTLHCNDTHALLAAGLAAYGLKSVRVVAMKHTMFPVRSPGKYMHLADRLICVSNAVADLCCESGIPIDHLRVIHPGIEQPQVDPRAVEQVRQQWLPAGKKHLIVAVGNLLSCKGHQTLVAAAARLKEMGLRAQTLIAGEGKQRQALESQIRDFGVAEEVHLLGFRADANTLMAAADVVAHPAKSEGLCLTVAAAMMLRRPIVATAVGGLGEVLGIDQRMDTVGPYGATIEPGDAAQLAHQLHKVLDSRSQQASLEQACNYAQERFTTLPMTNATLNLYHDLWQNRAA